MGKLYKHQKNKTESGKKKKKIIIEPNKHEMLQEYIERYKGAWWLQSIGLQELNVH